MARDGVDYAISGGGKFLIWWRVQPLQGLEQLNEPFPLHIGCVSKSKELVVVYHPRHNNILYSFFSIVSSQNYSTTFC